MLSRCIILALVSLRDYVVYCSSITIYYNPFHSYCHDVVINGDLSVDYEVPNGNPKSNSKHYPMVNGVRNGDNDSVNLMLRSPSLSSPKVVTIIGSVSNNLVTKHYLFYPIEVAYCCYNRQRCLTPQIAPSYDITNEV